MMRKLLLTKTMALFSFFAFNQSTDTLLTLKQLKDQKVYTDLKEALKHPEKVYALNLNGQRLDSLPTSIGKLINLQYLTLSIGPKPDVPKSVLRRAKHIGGGIYHLDRGTGRYVASNNLTQLPASFSHLSKLQYLDLGYNEFEELPVDFTVFKHLKSLRLAGCRGLVDNLEEINALKSVLPSDCKISFMDDNNTTQFWWPFEN